MLPILSTPTVLMTCYRTMRHMTATLPFLDDDLKASMTDEIARWKAAHDTARPYLGKLGNWR